MLVEHSHLCHLLCAKSEIEDIKVLLHAFYVYALWDGYNSALCKPAECHLSSCFTIFSTYSSEGFILYNAVCTLPTEWSPRHYLCISLIHDRQDIILLCQNVALQLVDHWFYINIMGKVKEASSLKVRYTNGSHFTAAIGFFHSTPCTENIAVCLVDKQKVYIICIEFAQTLINTGSSFLFSCIRNPYLRNEEKLVTSKSTLAPCTSYSFFITICLCCIDQAVTHFQSLTHTTLTLVRTY